VVVGAVFLAPAFDGALASSEWLLGLVGYPTLLLVWQWIRSRRDPTPINATGPVGFALNLAGFLALYLTPIYLPALAHHKRFRPYFLPELDAPGCRSWVSGL
jgi:hypothetical protein